MDRMN